MTVIGRTTKCYNFPFLCKTKYWPVKWKRNLHNIIPLYYTLHSQSLLTFIS